MKQFSDFKAEKASGGREILPAGGYVVNILGAKEVTTDYGKHILLSFDVAEGEYKDFFNNDWKAQTGEDKKWRGTYRLNEPKDDGSEKDGWTKRTFGNAIWAVEDSNNGYHWNWNEETLVGKTVGVIFRNKEWEFSGKTGWTTECGMLCGAEDIRSGKYKPLKDKPLPEKASGFDTAVTFSEVKNNESDLPF